MQKKEEFDRSVYSALEQLTEKLQDQKNLQAIKMTYFIQDGDTVAKTPSRQMVISSEEKVQIINKNGTVKTNEIIAFKKHTRGNVVKDSILINGNNEHINIVLNGEKASVVLNTTNKKQPLEKLIREKAKSFGDSSEIKDLVDKMMTEIKVMDTEIKEDALNVLIKKTLDAKGLFLPFEFSLQKLEKEKQKILAQSKKFSGQTTFYKRDLSIGRVIDTHEFLFLQFPHQKDFVLAGMKSSLILSLIFSAIIIGVFYYVIRLIWKQKKLSDIKNDFVNNMTHELKTPIATISLALDAINNPLIKNNEEKFKEYAQILKEENQKLNQHVERVLQMALLDKGKLQLIKKPVNLVSALQSVIDSFALQQAEKKAKLEFNYPPEKIIVQGDEQHLQTVFSNLLDNALKYSGQECVISITITNQEDRVTIVFKDNGIGISAEHKERIFDKFYRAQGGNLHDVKGFGLGLSYAKSIIEEYGGTLEGKSETGKGSEFIIKF